jgi:riboflavin kinase/FMN adenylyltransferase
VFSRSTHGQPCGTWALRHATACYQKDTTPRCRSFEASTTPIAPACAVTIGNFDGVHRGHQAMLALLNSEARHRGVPSCVLTFEPHPRDYFAAVHRKPELAPARIATLRDKLGELAKCGVDQCVILKFDARLSSQVPEAFIDDVLVQGLGAKYVLVGDDFRFGAKRAGDYAMLDSRPAAAWASTSRA